MANNSGILGDLIIWCVPTWAARISQRETTNHLITKPSPTEPNRHDRNRSPKDIFCTPDFSPHSWFVHGLFDGGEWVPPECRHNDSFTAAQPEVLGVGETGIEGEELGVLFDLPCEAVNRRVTPASVWHMAKGW